VRGCSIDPSSVALLDLGDRPVLEWVIETSLQATTLSRIVVTSSDAEVSTYVQGRMADNQLLWMPRPPELARLNQRADATIKYVLEQDSIRVLNPDVVIVLSVECPLLAPRYIDDAVNTFSLFDVEGVVSVRQESAMFYQHDGCGLRNILNQERFTRLEREILYRYAGGLSGFRSEVVNKEVNAGSIRLGHIVVDQRSALVVQTAFDLTVARFLVGEGAACS
jgi:CMP-N-acetylneuraminic acid synthetase